MITPMAAPVGDIYTMAFSATPATAAFTPRMAIFTVSRRSGAYS